MTSRNKLAVFAAVWFNMVLYVMCSRLAGQTSDNSLAVLSFYIFIIYFGVCAIRIQKILRRKE